MAADHGNTPAAWTAVTIIIAGSAVGGVAVVVNQPTLLAVSGGIIVLGCVAGKVLQMMGLGRRSYAEDAVGD